MTEQTDKQEMFTLFGDVRLTNTGLPALKFGSLAGSEKDKNVETIKWTHIVLYISLTCLSQPVCGVPAAPCPSAPHTR